MTDNPKAEPMFEVAYSFIAFGKLSERTIGEDFALASAAQMAKTLFTVPQWGDVQTVTISRTDRTSAPDTRSIAEIESNVLF